MDVSITFDSCQCRFVNPKTNFRCKKNASFDGYCITHYRCVKNFNRVPSYKVDVQIYLGGK